MKEKTWKFIRIIMTKKVSVMKKYSSIIYQGSMYRTTGKQIPAEVDESAIVGEISSVVPLNQLPTKEGEANFGEIGDQYAITSDGLLVKMNNEWTLFELSEMELSDGAPLAPDVSDKDLESVSYIEVMSGLTGQRIKVKDDDSVQKVMDDIESLKYKRRSQGPPFKLLCNYQQFNNR